MRLMPRRYSRPVTCPSSDDLPSTLIDLTDTSLADLRALDPTVLGGALRRIWYEADHPEDAQAGFQSAL
jgi:FXSXX-COOH protein